MAVAKVSKAHPKTTNWHIAAHAFDTIKTCKTDVREHTHYIWFPLCIPHFSLSSPDFLLPLHSFFLFSGSPLSLFLPFFLPPVFFFWFPLSLFLPFFFLVPPLTLSSFFFFFLVIPSLFFFLFLFFSCWILLLSSLRFLSLRLLSFLLSPLSLLLWLFSYSFFSFWFLLFFFTTVFFLALLLPSPLPNSLPSLFLSFFFLFFFSAFCYHFNSTPQYPFFGSPKKTATSMF